MRPEPECGGRAWAANHDHTRLARLVGDCYAPSRSGPSAWAEAVWRLDRTEGDPAGASTRIRVIAGVD